MKEYVFAIKRCLDFKGRATRREHWMFVLVNTLAVMLLNVAGLVIYFPALKIIYSLMTFLPGLSVGVRRLHDRDKSGWWSMIAFVPVVGLVVVLVQLVMAGTPGSNRFGSAHNADLAYS
ncbi:MAG: DUF805 domain-containing protein [Chloroflexota bacterium]